MIDTVGKSHEYSRIHTNQGYYAVPAAMWKHEPEDNHRHNPTETDIDHRVMGPYDRSFPYGIEWQVGNKKYKVDEMSIKLLTRAVTYAKMKPPASQAAWEDATRLASAQPWNKIWKIKSFFTTPRDEVTWLKLMHRNLWVANRDPAYDSKCRAPGCTHDESMMHLAVCPIITREYWDKVRNLLVQLGLPAPNTHRFLLPWASSRQQPCSW